MRRQDVFEVGEVRQIENDTWLVRGRVYEDLKVGDVVFADVPGLDGTAEALPFRIIAISTYGFDVDMLYRVMTGDLILCGQHGNRLKEAPMLVQLVQASDPLAPAADSTF